MKYLLNLNTRTIHDAFSADGRCKMKTIGDGNKMIFSDYCKAKNYLPKGKKATAPCTFCLGKDYEQELEKTLTNKKIK